MRRWAVACLLALLAAVSAPSAFAALLAIDLGSESLKLALVAPGRTPISIVINEISKRKSPVAVSFINGERALGEEAHALGVRYPDRVLYRTRDLLGRPADSADVKAALASAYLPYDIKADAKRKTAVYTVDGMSLSAEEVMASVLHYAKLRAEATTTGEIKDIVIAVPAFFSQAQRQGLYDAASIAGLNVMSLVNGHVAAAIQYGIERDFTNRTEHIILYDFGAGSTVAALLEYSSWKAKEFGKVKHHGQFEVKSVKWDATAGADALDLVLSEHFALEANAQIGNGVDIRKHPKSMSKLKKQAKRTKEILSANMASPISVESIYEEFDFRSQITREKFEELAAPIFERAAAPLRALIQETGVKVEDLANVELIGGGTRIPRVQALLQEVLGGRALDRHLDSDEAIVMGAGLTAANLSTTFRLRKFGASDTVVYPINVESKMISGSGMASEEADGGDDAAPDDTAEPAKADGASSSGVKPLFPLGKRVPSRRVLTFTDVKSDFDVTATYAPGSHAPPPSSPAGDVIGVFRVSGVEKATAKNNATGKVTVTFSLDRGGMLCADKASMQVEVIETYEIEVPANETAADKEKEEEEEAEEEADEKEAEEKEAAADKAEEEKAGDKDAKDAKADAKADAKDAKADKKTAKKAAAKKEKKPKMVKVKRTRPRMAQVPLEIAPAPSSAPSLPAEDLKAAVARMREIQKKDEIRHATAEAKSTLESYILSMREKVGEDEGLAAVSTEEQRDTFRAQLTDAEDWLYMDGSEGGAEDFRGKLAELQKVGAAMEKRASERTRRPEAVAKARAFAELARKVVAAWNTSKPHINETEKQGLLDKVDALVSWLDEAEAKQATKAVHEEPAFFAQDVLKELKAVDAVLNKLKKKPAPKPPKAEKNATTVLGNETGAGAANGTEAGAEKEAEAGMEDGAASAGGAEEAGEDGAAGTSAGGDDEAEGDAAAGEEDHDEL